MINVTEEFKSNKRTTYAKVECTFSDGTTETFTDNIMQGENNIIDESTAVAFPIGDSICKYVTLSLDNSNQQYSDKDFFNATLIYYLYQDKESGTTETIRKGTYTVSEAKYYDDLIEITALDDMWKADKPFKTNLTLPQTLLKLVTDACDICQIAMGFSSLQYNPIISIIPDGITFRDFLGYAAMGQCANARMDVDNKLQFKKWDFSVIQSTLSDYIGSPALSSDDIVITGVKITNDNNTFSKGHAGYELSLSNRLLSDEQCQVVAQNIYNCVANYPFRTLDGELMTDASIEFGDIAESINRQNNKYLTPITSVSYALQGITNVRTVTEEPIRNASTYSSLSEDAIVEARKLVAKEKTEREQAIENLAGKIVSSTSGLYMTVQQQETGGSIYYMHNKETLEESDIIWKLTAEAFAISTDGGQTYPYGFVVDGELITRLLYAEGINANYIDAGSLAVKDSRGHITFQADVDTGKVIIDTDNVKLNENGIMELLSAYISDKIKMRAFGSTIPPSYTDYVDAIYANTGSVVSKSMDWTNWLPLSSAIYGKLLLNVGASNVPLKILANTEFKESILCDKEVYVNSDLFADRIGCNNLKVNNKEVITAGNISSQSVKYATTAGSAPANGGNASTVGGYSADGLKVKFYNVSLSNVACTTRSANGAYYSGVLDTISNHGITQDKIIGITITNWAGAAASFTPYCHLGVIRIMSDISQTVLAIEMKVAYITY